MLDAGTSADTIDISNTLPQVNVTVNGNAGADTINLATNGNASNVTLNGGADGDTLNIRAVATGSVVLANGGAGNDTVNVSTDAPANTGTLDAIVGTLGIDTGGDTDKIVLSDQGQTTTGQHERRGAQRSGRRIRRPHERRFHSLRILRVVDDDAHRLANPGR